MHSLSWGLRIKAGLPVEFVRLVVEMTMGGFVRQFFPDNGGQRAMIEIWYGVFTGSMIGQRNTASWMEWHSDCDRGVHPTRIIVHKFFCFLDSQFFIELTPLDIANFSR